MNELRKQLELAEKFIEDNLSELCQELIQKQDGAIALTKLREVVILCDFVTENRYLFAERLIQNAAVKRCATLRKLK